MKIVLFLETISRLNWSRSSWTSFLFFLDISSIRYRNARWSIGDPSSLKSHFASVKTSRLSDLICNDRQGCGTRYRAELNIRRLNICTIPISTIPDIHTHTHMFSLSLSFSLSSRLDLENVSREYDDTRAFNVLPETVCHTRFPTLSRNKIRSPGVSPGFVYTWAEEGEGRGGKEDVAWNLSGKETIALERGSNRRRFVVVSAVLAARNFSFPLIHGYSSRIKPTDNIHPL